MKDGVQVLKQPKRLALKLRTLSSAGLGQVLGGATTKAAKTSDPSSDGCLPLSHEL